LHTGVKTAVVVGQAVVIVLPKG